MKSMAQRENPILISNGACPGSTGHCQQGTAGNERAEAPNSHGHLPSLWSDPNCQTIFADNLEPSQKKNDDAFALAEKPVRPTGCH